MCNNVMDVLGVRQLIRPFFFMKLPEEIYFVQKLCHDKRL